MILFFEGTPGSGKTYHSILYMLDYLKHGQPVISNFDILKPESKIGDKGGFQFLSNDEITPDRLTSFSNQYLEQIGMKRVPEERILLVIDEASILFNAREWKVAVDRKEWITFFSQHRKLGYRIILISQMLESVDKQIRELVEFNFKHRKMRNISFLHQFINFIRGGDLIQVDKYFTALGTRDERTYIKCKDFIYSCYNTNIIFREKEKDGKNPLPMV